MTYHSYSKWTFDDEPTDLVIADVIGGLEYNRQYNSDGCYKPSAYAIMSATDQLIYNIAGFLDAHEGEEIITKQAVEMWLGEAPESAKIIAKSVLAELNNTGSQES